MLVRSADRPLFTPALRFLVLDEIHSYRGALATEIACLIRRLKARCQLKPGDMRCIGTSATVSEGAGGDEALVAFVRCLFGEEFSVASILGEETIARVDKGAAYTPPLPKLDPIELNDFPVDDALKILALAQRITGKEPPQEGALASKVAAMLDGNRVVGVLEAACVQPYSLLELAAKVRESIPAAKDIDDTSLQALIEAYLLVGSTGSDDDPPILRPKLHTFFHGVYDVGLCMNPACRTLIRDGSDQCHNCGSVVRPAVLCRTCGQDFVKVRFPDDPRAVPQPNDDFKSDDKTGFITPLIHLEAGDDGDDDDSGEEKPKKRKGSAHDKLVDEWVCHRCGMVHEKEPEACGHCGSTSALTVQKVLRGRGNTCPVCNSTYTRGDILTLLRSGIASTNSLLATHHLDLLSGEDRKLIVFADNRQEAAHQAGYMGDRHRQFAVRHAIESVVRQSGQDGIGLKDLPQRLLTRFQEIGLIPLRLTQDDRRKWLRALEIEAVSEFCRSTHQRVSVENLALVEVQYEFLGDLAKDPAFVEACKLAGIKVDDGALVLRCILDRMRRSRAVGFDFFQRYLDPEREPWVLLVEDPYAVTFPEHERSPVFFMLERSEAARHAPGGFTFQALHKDTPRSGGAILKIMRVAGITNDSKADAWIRESVRLLQEYEILQTPAILPPRVRTAIGRGRPLQISPSVIRMVPAQKGYRCQRCQVWRPYRGQACFSPKCRGAFSEQKECGAETESYYVKLYTSQTPKRMLVEEHTAQIDQDQRAKREMDFKNGRLDVLVCSPTLELGINIGPLLTVLLRNAPPTPANYIQRVGRAGRRLRIGFASTFCGMGAHDRHCFENPPWLVRGEFSPPSIRMDNAPILARHVRSFVLEQLSKELPQLMGDLVEDLDQPTQLDLSEVTPLLNEVREQTDRLSNAAQGVFDGAQGLGDEFLRRTIDGMPGETERILNNWFQLIQRLHKEFEEYRTITADRQAKQKAAARERAYRELTRNQNTAYMLNYLANEGLLPSYQFPTDTFSLEPGVNDTPTLRRPAWIALFEFAPGNLVYANGHKLKSIRAFFEGRNKTSTSASGGTLEASGRVRGYCFCDKCGFATEDARNTCPVCGEQVSDRFNVAFIESFEAEQSTQITSAEEGRERAYFQRKEHLIAETGTSVEIYPYPFSQLELCNKAKILVTNWGRRPSFNVDGERFDLCPSCGKHRPSSLTDKRRAAWDTDHAKRCSGQISPYILGYEFSADALVLPMPGRLVPQESSEVFARTLGSSLVAGAVELLEVEPDEVAFFYHNAPGGGVEIVFYETMPGGAGYLRRLAASLPKWAAVSMSRLFDHDCAKACYRCLKSYRNQPFHDKLDKNAIGDVLFQLSNAEMIGAIHSATRSDGIRQSTRWVDANTKPPTQDTVIERRLLGAIQQRGRLPDPVAQREFHSQSGLLTIADFAYEDEKIAIYCDGFAYHGSKEALATDAEKRNTLQAQGWAVLTFWGKTILKYPERCEEQIWRAFEARRRT
ncbi:MAG TPA: helicase-related protein [Kiritimatiellia bacterium]|nr:helicase-related protein [Kiritimatiellia bacterium]